MTRLLFAAFTAAMTVLSGCTGEQQDLFPSSGEIVDENGNVVNIPSGGSSTLSTGGAGNVPSTGGAPSEACTCVGEVGPAGPEGPPGSDGVDGVDGRDGIDGARGEVGPAGPMGSTGSVGPAGAQGLTGATGAQGPQGIPGKDGADGIDGTVDKSTMYVRAANSAQTNAIGELDAFCDAGDFVITGGCYIQHQGNGSNHIISSYPTPQDQWSQIEYNGIGWHCTFGLVIPTNVSVYAVCVSAQ